MPFGMLLPRLVGMEAPCYGGEYAGDRSHVRRAVGRRSGRERSGRFVVRCARVVGKGRSLLDGGLWTWLRMSDESENVRLG